MTKKLLIIGLVVLATFGCFKKETTLTDAAKFKQEYESLNGKETTSGQVTRTITIPEDNPIVYKSAEELAEMINNKETFVVYFGFNSCPWCRSVIETLLKVAKDLKISKIYYVDVKDIRDVKELAENGKDIETTKEGSKGYNELIKLLSEVLRDYTLTAGKKTISAGEKRIYAPNIVSVVKGEAKSLTTGVSDKETDSYMELTDEILTETYDKIKEVLEVVKADSACEANNAC